MTQRPETLFDLMSAMSAVIKRNAADAQRTAASAAPHPASLSGNTVPESKLVRSEAR